MKGICNLKITEKQISSCHSQNCLGVRFASFQLLGRNIFSSITLGRSHPKGSGSKSLRHIKP